jgi:PhnB protein
MTAANIYLNFNGNTEEAFNFYKSVFGGEFAMIQRFGETPEADKMPAELHNKIMHVALPLGPNQILMATDALESMGQQLTLGNNFSITLSTETKEEADTLYARLADGGKTDMPMQDTFWGAYFGMLTDPYDVQWMVSYDENYQN